jgi:hypothetical protein
MSFAFAMIILMRFERHKKNGTGAGTFRFLATL